MKIAFVDTLRLVRNQDARIADPAAPLEPPIIVFDTETGEARATSKLLLPGDARVVHEHDPAHELARVWVEFDGDGVYVGVPYPEIDTYLARQRARRKEAAR